MDLLESSLKKLIRLQPDHAHAYNALGYSFADHNMRLPEAHELIEKALQLAPDDPFIIDSMGWVLYRMGKNKQALEFLRKAYSARSDPEIAAHLGEVLWVAGERGEAEKIWQEAAQENAGQRRPQQHHQALQAVIGARSKRTPCLRSEEALIRRTRGVHPASPRGPFGAYIPPAYAIAPFLFTDSVDIQRT